MNNNQKYTSLVDYSIKLNRSIEKFDIAIWGKSPKQMGSFNVTLRNITAIIENLKEIQKMRDEMRKLTTLDSEAKKDNKSAKKAAEKISSIKAELNKNYERLKNEFFKQIDLAGKQCKEVSRAIKDKEDRARFNEASRDFERMVYESRTEKSIIPINEKYNLGELREDREKREHGEKEKEIDSITDSKLQGTDKLESALGVLTTILAMTPKNDLSKEVRKEVAQIKKALPPKTIVIAQNGLERLRHSSHLLLDLEQISEIMKTTYRFTGSDGKLQKINKQLEDLQSLLQQALNEENKKNMEIKQEQDNIQSKVNFATKAVQTYSEILEGNVRLEQEQARIVDHTHGFYAENERLKVDEENANAEAQAIQTKPTNREEWDDSLKVRELNERARNDREEIKNNEEYMSNKMSEIPVVTLPPEYTNMKKRLQSVSSLYHMQMAQSQELSNGGMSR